MDNNNKLIYTEEDIITSQSDTEQPYKIRKIINNPPRKSQRLYNKLLENGKITKKIKLVSDTETDTDTHSEYEDNNESEDIEYSDEDSEYEDESEIDEKNEELENVSVNEIIKLKLNNMNKYENI